MKKHLFVLTIFCATLFASCDPDRRTAQNEGYPEADQIPPGDNPIIENGDGGTISENNQLFITQAANSYLLEIELGQLAQEKATKQEVKDFSQTLLQDHRAANEQLNTIAQTKNIVLPTQLDPAYQERINQLKALSGQEFEKAYIAFVAEVHQRDIGLFEERLNDVQDQDLKQWIEATLPTLRQHNEHIGQLQQNL